MEISEARIAVLVENQYQELELWYPVLRFREEGADVRVVGTTATDIYASKLGYPARADLAVGDVDLEAFDALIIPGGFAPEQFRRNPATVELVRRANERGMLIAAICHAGWLLASAGIAKGRRLTSVPNIKDDLIHAGATWLDQPLVVDGNLITSRLPNELPEFCAAIRDGLVTRDRAAGELEPIDGLPASMPAYDRMAVLKNRAAGPGSANYRGYAVLA